MIERTLEHQDYLELADACLEQYASALEDFDPDEVDFFSADGVLTLEFADGARYILNRQAAALQMWFAAGSRAWHYNWSGEAWLDDRDGHELKACISRVLSEKLGRDVSL
ncbi:MAG: iron donor protein CyaY [Planctomycetota bacterium]|nr:iron donor protein CyaY [Planctomycetota bacterium]